MAINITIEQLAAALRVTLDDETRPAITRLHTVGILYVPRAAPNAPSDVQDECLVLWAGYLYDKPTATSGRQYATAWTNSGAAELASLWAQQRAIAIEEAATAAAVAPTTPGGQINQAAVNELIAAAVFPWALDGNTDDVPADKLPDVPDVATWALNGNGDAIPADKLTNAPGGGSSGGGAIVDVADGHLPAPPVAMRIGWAQTTDPLEVVFVRANDHPIDGVSVGTTAGLNTPPFPPALATDDTLHLHFWIAGALPITFLGTRGLLDQNYVASELVTEETALSVEGVAGRHYATLFRYAADTQTFIALLQGELILTEDDVPAWARASNSEAIPPEKLTNAPGGTGEDATARTAAAVAQTTADQGVTDAATAQAAAEAAATAAAAAQTTATAAGGGAPNIQYAQTAADFFVPLTASAPGTAAVLETVTITPSTSDKKVLVSYAVPTAISGGANGIFEVYRQKTGAGFLMLTEGPFGAVYSSGANDPGACVGIDSPNTDQPVIYELRVWRQGGTHAANVNVLGRSLILQEF